MNILLAGVGGMGATHYNNYIHIPSACVTGLVGVTDYDRQMAAEWGLPLFATVTEAAKAAHFDIADLCVPTFLHKQLALEAFRCGLHVITEKPCALTWQDGKDMFDAARAAGKQLYVGQVVRFTRETEVLKNTVSKKLYGKPVDGFFERLSARPGWVQSGWLLDKKKSGLLPFDLHIHDLDLIVSLFGMPDGHGIAAVSERNSIQDHFRVNYTWHNGLTVCAEAAWFNACLPFTARWRVYFENGLMVYDGKNVTGYGADGQTVIFDTADTVQVPGGANLPQNGWFLRELSHFIDCAEKNIPSPAVPEEEILGVLSLLETMQ